MVLFAKLERLPVRVCHELSCGEALTVGQGTDFGIFGTPGAGEVGHQLRIQSSATLLELGVIGRRRLQEVSRLPPIPPPVGTEVLLHVLNRIFVVVGEH